MLGLVPLLLGLLVCIGTGGYLEFLVFTCYRFHEILCNSCQARFSNGRLFNLMQFWLCAWYIAAWLCHTRKTLLSKAHGQYCRFAFHQATTRKQFHRFIVFGGFANGQVFNWSIFTILVHWLQICHRNLAPQERRKKGISSIYRSPKWRRKSDERNQRRPTENWRYTTIDAQLGASIGTTMGAEGVNWYYYYRCYV